MQLIWLYEDQAEANNKLKDSIQAVIDSLKENIKSLEDYKKSLRISDQSPLTTAQKYNETRSQIDSLLNVINTPAQTDEQIQAQSAAVQQLQTVSSSFLDLSRTLFASSGQYNADFDWILRIIDTATGSLEDQLTDAEKQLAATEITNAELKTLNETALRLLSTITLPGSSTSIASFASETTVDPIVAKLDMVATEQSQVESLSKLDIISLSLSAANDSLMGITDSINNGVNAIITSLGSVIQDTFISQVNNLQADTRNIEAAIYNTTNNNTPILQAMVEQLKVLNEKVTTLEQATIDIGLMNVEATKENTDRISSTVNESVSTNLFNTNLQNRAMIA